MTTLLDKSLENLKVLINIKENQLLSSSPLRVLTIQNDFITVDNLHEIESAIHFTFHQIISSLNITDWKECNKRIKDIDAAIDNIFKNNNLNKLLEDDSELFKIALLTILAKQLLKLRKFI